MPVLQDQPLSQALKSIPSNSFFQDFAQAIPPRGYDEQTEAQKVKFMLSVTQLVERGCGKNAVLTHT